MRVKISHYVRGFASFLSIYRSDFPGAPVNQNDKESNIKLLIDTLNTQGKSIPINLSNIPDFPYQNYKELLDNIKNGNARLLRFSYTMEPSLLTLFSTTSNNIKNYLGLFIAYGGIIATITTSFFYNWWLLIATPFLFIKGTSITKNSYNSTIFDAALDSEISFCLLYYLGQISIEIQTPCKHYYHENK